MQAGVARSKWWHAMQRNDPMMMLGRLSLKQHAVMTAVFGGLTNAQIAELMHCNRSIVQGHLNAVLTHLHCTDRAHLVAQWADVVARIDEQDYESRFGLSRRWFESLDPATLERLAVKKAKGPVRPDEACASG